MSASQVSPSVERSEDVKSIVLTICVLVVAVIGAGTGVAQDEKKAAELEKKLRKSEFTLEDFRDQMVQIRKMGSLSDLLGMIPGMGKVKQLKNLQVDDRELKSGNATR